MDDIHAPKQTELVVYADVPRAHQIRHAGFEDAAVIARTGFRPPENPVGAQPGVFVTTQGIFIPAGSHVRLEQPELEIP